MTKRRAVVVAATLLAATALTGCSEEEMSTAQQSCYDALEAKFGPEGEGLVSVGDFTENSSPVRTKVEGSVVYRPQGGAGDRVDTWFTCQLDDAGRVTTLTVED